MNTLIPLIIALCCSLICVNTTARVYERPANGDDMVGEAFIVHPNNGERLTDVGERYDIGVFEMIEANPQFKGRRLKSSDRIVVPSSYILPIYQEGLVINIPELRLYYFPKGSNKVYTYPVGLGRSEWRTPTAKAHVVRKKEHPNWYPPKSIKEFVYEQTGKVLEDVVPPGPENPLGPAAIYISKSGYLIHGTNQPWTIGKLVSSGCIRLFNDDIVELYSMVQKGEPVHLIHHPYKIGWNHGDLFIEAHVPVASDEPPSKLNVHDVEKAIQQKLKRHPEMQARINWRAVDKAVHEQRGIPHIIGESAQHMAERAHEY